MKTSTVFLLFFSLLISVSCSKKKEDNEVNNPFYYRQYISQKATSAHSVTDPITIELSQPVDFFEEGEELSNDYINIKPKVAGKLILESPRQLVFYPKKELQPNTEYTVTLKLNKLFDDLPDHLKNYTFKFPTIEPNFLIDIEYLQSYSRDWQYLEGTIESADYINPKQLPELFEAVQDGKSLSINWKNAEKPATYFRFIIDSIKRKETDSDIQLNWDGSAIKADTKGTKEYLIPGYNDFKVVDIQTESAPKASLSINFSDAIDPDQDFSGLIKIDKLNDLKYQVEGNVLYVYPSQRVTGELDINVYPGIKNTEGFGLKEVYSDQISFEQIKPQVELISKGVILPNAKSTPLYFKTVNLKAVDVRVIKIYEDNILEFLQEGNLNSDNYNLRRVGRRIAKKTIPLEIKENEKDNWKAHALKLSDFFKADPGALYQVEISFKKKYSTYICSEEDTKTEDLSSSETIEEASEEEREEQYWNNETYNWRNYIYDWENRENPCYPVYYQPDNFAQTNLLGSDLSLIAKKGADNSYHIFAANILSAQPESNTKITLYNYQKQIIEELSTNAQGEAIYDGDQVVAFAIAQKNTHYAYANLDNSKSLSLSKFDVSGTNLEKGLKGFIYTERGVHRPGDSIHLTFVLNDKENPLPKEVPVKLEVKNARGKLVQRTVSVEGEEDSKTKALNRFYYFSIPTKATDETGNWEANINVGGAEFSKNLWVETVKPNRLKIKLDFDQKVLDTKKPISGLLTGSWLHGAPARNLKAEMEIQLYNAGNVFEGFDKFTFTDPVRKFNQTEIKFLTAQLSNDGEYRFSENINLDRKAPGMLKATFLTKLFEGGGDFSLDVFSKNLAPYDYFVGLRSPETQDFGSLDTDENNTFEVVSLNKNGETAGNRKIKVQVFQLEWRWWWSSKDDRLSQYKDATVHKPYGTYELTTDTQGKADFKIKIPEKDRGRFLIRVIDESSGHATGTTIYFMKNWYDDPGNQDAESAKMLVFSADKKKYDVGEEATLTFPSGSGGHALISIENGTKVISTKWIKTQKKETEFDLKITPEMAPNIFVNISLLQPHERVKNDLPIRLYGVIPIEVEDPQTILKPQIDMPAELKPKERFNIKVSEKNNKPMTYTLAVVEEGLLDLTRFTTPDIHGRFYSREALGVKTFDLYDYIIGAYSGSVNNIYEIGGDDVAESGKKNKANRFKPVAKFLGPFYLKPGETQQHQVEMPNYIGSVRTMLIAGDATKAAYGKAEKTTPVKKPLMVLASLPRKLSPGETVDLPVTVFTMDKSIKNVKVDISTTDAFEALDGNSKTISFDQPDEKLINFSYKLKPTNEIQKVLVEVSSNGEKASYEVEIDVENPNPYSHKITDLTIDKNAEKSLQYSPFGVAGTNEVKLELSTLPPMNFTKLLKYLEHYPHGCVEQTTSTAFPLLFLDEVTELSSNKKANIKSDIKSVIQKVGDAQLPNGSLPFWPGQRQTNEWVTSYSGHFMLEAKEKGYALPLSFLNNWLRYQKNEARQWNIHDYSYNTSLTQSYRLYTLALAGQPELAAMNRLRESNHMTNEAKWRLAAAYALAGKKEVAKDIANTANTDFSTYRYDYYNYGSPIRNQAMALETMVILEDDQQRELAVSLAKKMYERDWMNTQETSYSLLSMAKMLRKAGGKDLDLTIAQDGETQTVKTKNALAEINLKADDKENSFKIVNHKDNVVYASLYQEGQPQLGKEIASKKNLSLKTAFFDGDGKVLDVSKIRQGTEIEARVSVTNTSGNNVKVVALTQVFPSGWEIVNTRFTDSKQGGISGEADYTDIRDDRVHFYFDLKSKETQTFKVKLNASYLGKYYLPGTFAEGMYDRDFYAQEKGKWIEIHQ